MFLGNVDVAIANVAAPSIRAGLHASGVELELVVSGYTLAVAVLLVLPLVLGQEAGWPAWTPACLAASVLAFGALWAVERKVSARGGTPLVDPRLVARPAVALGLASQAAAMAVYSAVLASRAWAWAPCSPRCSGT